MSGIVRKYRGIAPKLGSGVYLAPTAALVGDVELGDEASVWYGAVLRGDVGRIRIGRRTNVQDNACIHMSKDLSHAEIADHVTIGHAAVIHGARIESGALIGIGAIVLDKAVVEEGALVGAMSLVTPGMRVPAGQLVMGQPARVVRAVKDAERRWMAETVTNYVGYARDYMRGSR
jgi:carbonic anhydrase/acetyltransferase-like protein (isoleucine patch superfamily)